MDPRPAVLLVEDDPPLSRVMKLILEAEGFVVQVSSDRWEALRAIEDAAPDALVMDLLVGGPPAQEFIDKARELGFGGPILLCTGLGQAHDLPVDGVLQKPFELDDLPLQLRALLQPRT